MFVLVLSACSTNPVTGKRELFIVSPTQELSIGEREYLPNQQSKAASIEPIQLWVPMSVKWANAWQPLRTVRSLTNLW